MNCCIAVEFEKVGNDHGILKKIIIVRRKIKLAYPPLARGAAKAL